MARDNYRVYIGPFTLRECYLNIYLSLQPVSFLHKCGSRNSLHSFYNRECIYALEINARIFEESRNRISEMVFKRCREKMLEI